MTPREIDAKIAEVVMGWERREGDAIVDTEKSWRSGEPTDERWHNHRAWYFNGARMACEECGDLPFFTSDATASKALRAKLIADGRSIQLYRHEKMTQFRFIIQNYANNTAHWAEGDDEEMAVALAALKVYGVEA